MLARMDATWTLLPAQAYQAVTPAGEDKTMVTLTSRPSSKCTRGQTQREKRTSAWSFPVTRGFPKASSMRPPPSGRQPQGNKFGASEQTDLIGSIIRNGTTVHIPFVTAGAVYTQRFILTNRGDKESQIYH